MIGRMVWQGLAVSFACLASVAYSCNLLLVDDASAAVAKLYQLATDQSQVAFYIIYIKIG